MKRAIGIITFFCLWILGCSLQDRLFNIESDYYLMLYGFAVGSFGNFIDKLISGDS